MERALEPMGLGFIPFLVLAATHVLVRRAGDAVSQQVVADYLVLDKARVSDAMRELESRGWISRGPSFPVGAWRVLISGNGRRVLRVTAKSLGDPSGGTG